MKFKIQAIRILNSIIPKNKKVLLFTSNPDFADNSAAIFKTISEDEKFADYKLFWITRELSLRKYKGYKCYKINSIKSFVVYFRAKYIFTTHGLYYGTSSRSQIKVGLWHGMPLKSLGAYSANNENYLKSIESEMYDFKYMIATSPLYREIMAKCFRMNEKDILVTGLPRNDELFYGKDSLEKLSIPVNEKTLCWLPTYRNPGSEDRLNGIYQQGVDYEYGIPLVNSETLIILNDLLKKEHMNLIIKIHGMQVFDKNKFPITSNIFVVTNNDLYESDIQLYNLLACSDALITDYSSVYIDYLATDKPMAFVIDDINEYGNDRGFVFNNPLDYMPGMKIHSFDEFIQFIMTVRQNKDEYKQVRQSARDTLNIFTDKKNSRRVIDFVFDKK